MKTITKSQLREHIAKLVAEQIKSLSPEGQKALEQSKVAKQNKDAQKKRAAAKQSMRGMSVESADPTVEEQFSRVPGDKRQSDEMDFFDTDEFHDEYAGFGDDGYTEEDALRDALESEEEDGIFTDSRTGVKTDHSFHGKW